MKYLSKIGLALLVAGIIAIPSFTKAKADPQRLPSGAVVFAATQLFEEGFPKSYYVFVVSQGQHAPTIKPGTELALVLENLLANGFEIQTLPGLQFMAIRK